MMSSNKRKRTYQEDYEILCITDLPDNAIAHAASYLSKPSRAIFAVALTPQTTLDCKPKLDCCKRPSAANASDMNHILTSSPELWETLDFADIDKSLAEKLNDKDIYDILTAIGACTNTKCLKITGCVNILGGGLNPLRGSTVLEQIDLSCVGQYETPYLDPAPSISQQEVVPILDSIVRADGTSLTHIQLPLKWRTKEEGRSTQLTELLQTYEDLVLSQFDGKCSKCRELDCHKWIHCDPNHGPYYGLQNHTCCKCLKSFCDECETENETPWLSYCETCQKDYCADCNPSRKCDNCYGSHCKGCGIKKCDDCGQDFCPMCGPDEGDKCACWGEKVYCDRCLPNTYECEKEGCNGIYCNLCASNELCDSFCPKCTCEG